MSTTTSPRAPALPLRTGPVRFMVVAADGKSSNSWRFWTQPAGDAYVACRDNFKEGKISLHTSGHWRMAWDETAVAKNPALVAPGGDRVWEKWEPPPPFAPGVVAAVRLVFPTSELAIEPAQRTTKPWKAKHVAIEAAPQGIGKMTVVTLFVSDDEVDLRHESEPSYPFASLPLNGTRRAHLVAHFEPEGDVHDGLDRARRNPLEQVPERAVIPPGAYFYFWGHRSDGTRSLTGAQARPDER